MSARMAAATGDMRWSERIDEASPKLAAVVDEALAIATPEVGAALVTTTEEAWRGLRQMQQAALKLANGGERASAVALLESSDYNYLEAVYQSGIDTFGRDLMALAEAQAASLTDRAWLETGGLFVGLILVVGSILLKRGQTQLSLALAQTELVACTDPLTGLPNRRKLSEELKLRTSGQRRGSDAFAFLVLDLDRFKAVNDAHGHPAGDDLLQAVAARLQSTARAGDVVARLGGDEFAIIATMDAAHTGPEAMIASHLTKRIVETFETPFVLRNGVSVQVGTSVGVALNDRSVVSPEDLMQRADAALYRAKTDGRNRAYFFEPGIDGHVRERARLEADLRQAIQDGALVPHFQPILELQTGRLVGFEMLARWPLPEGGMISPAEFIPLAESANLIAPMTEHLMRSACQAALAWPADVTLACNVSPLLLRDQSFVDMLRGLLPETGLSGHRLVLEITESALLEDIALAGSLVAQMKTLGVSLALDDFGTGFSSLRHLRSLPFDKLKIDAGFVTRIAEDAESRTIVAAVIGLGQSLGMATVAEGIETEETAALLRKMGCELGQGWLFGRPAPANVTASLVQKLTLAETSPAVSMA